MAQMSKELAQMIKTKLEWIGYVDRAATLGHDRPSRRARLSSHSPCGPPRSRIAHQYQQKVPRLLLAFPFLLDPQPASPRSGT